MIIRSLSNLFISGSVILIAHSGKKPTIAYFSLFNFLINRNFSGLYRFNGLKNKFFNNCISFFVFGSFDGFFHIIWEAEIRCFREQKERENGAHIQENNTNPYNIPVVIVT